ncbi:MAG: S41 family peptidase [Alistipes onderdonkii]
MAAESVAGQQKYVVTDEKTVRSPRRNRWTFRRFSRIRSSREGGRKVGYLAYHAFDMGPGGASSRDDAYDRGTQGRLRRIQTTGVDELVLDLRYNGGGYISCCQLLCSMIVEAGALKRRVLHVPLQRRHERETRRTGHEVPRLGRGFRANLNLRRLYVLTGAWTASASELVVNALRPYIDVKTVGVRTEEKRGSHEIRDRSP